MPTQKQLANLIKYKKGQSGNIKGRARKFTTLLKEQGYQQHEINHTIQAMMAMTLNELKEVWENKKEATILELTIAGAMKKSIDRGSLYSIETLISRVYGKPKESVDMNQTIIQEQPLFPDHKPE